MYLYGVQGVVGSNPTVPTIFQRLRAHLRMCPFLFLLGHLQGTQTQNLRLLRVTTLSSDFDTG
jgi:hypothetical protein